MAEKRAAAGNNRRRKPRQRAPIMASVTADGRTGATRLYNLSASGALLGALPDIQLGELCKIELPGYGTLAGTVVRVTPQRIAVTFTPDAALRKLFDDPAEVYERLRDTFPSGSGEPIEEPTWP